MKRDLTITEGAAGERLDLFLSEALTRTRSQIQRLIRNGNVTVNGKVQKAGYMLVAKDLVTMDWPVTAPAAIETPDLPVLYEDDDILVIDKPAGLAVHHGAGSVAEATVADFARAHSQDPDPDRPGIVHRLDRDTSGLLIIAKSAQSKLFMQHEFSARKVHKTYLMLAQGRVLPPDAVIRLPLDRDPSKPLRRAVVSGGRESVTRYRTLANFDGYTLIEAKPETGRTHQLRVHFAAIGHPVAGDTTYGLSERPLGLTRQFLHAAALEFTAPNGQTVNMASPLPVDLEQVLTDLGGSGIIDW
jgi:23S rRNA pseudouridine1911/1915/1917 synthase